MIFTKIFNAFKKAAPAVIIILVIILLIPIIFAQKVKIEDKQPPNYSNQFPVTIDIDKKLILEDVEVNTYLEGMSSPFQATAFLSKKNFEKIFTYLAISISRLASTQNLALVSSEKFITIKAGQRKEEVANTFGKTLAWNEVMKKEFMTKKEGSNLPFSEGSYFPGVYVVNVNATPSDVQNLINKRFITNILARYGETTSEKIPLEVALSVASLIQRETIGTEDMRLVSGIIWNRIFANMKLQLDATLQYAKANKTKNSVWWPTVESGDKFIKSPYNTYLNNGLPPTPIANPSTAAVLAALNPLKTTCLYYFHDEKGDMHCTDTYKEHVGALKLLYGKGK